MLNRTLLVTITSFLLPLTALAADTSSLGFVPLTSIPGIADAGNASTLPVFLNTLYKLAIGVAAVLAVLQIVRAGIMYMGGDSVTEKKDAKNLITLSIGGLLLVLSPVIVFSVINPKILDLKIGGLDELASTTPRSGSDTTSTTPGSSGTELIWQDGSISRSAAETKCRADGGTSSYVCKKQDGTQRTLLVSQSCSAGEVGIAFCTRPTGSGTSGDTANLCAQFEQKQSPVGGATCREADPDLVTISNSCCSTLAEGAVCCGRPKAVATELHPDLNIAIAITRYVYDPIAGSSEALDAVPGDKTKFDAYKAECISKSGTVNEQNANSASVCSTSDLAAFPDGPRKPYIKCMASTISCRLP